jgi:hypothetical protein
LEPIDEFRILVDIDTPIGRNGVQRFRDQKIEIVIVGLERGKAGGIPAYRANRGCGLR